MDGNPFYIRPIQKQDLPSLQQLVQSMKIGMASLPNNTSLLKKRIQTSIKAFQASTPPLIDQYYLFVLINPKTNKIAGVSGILNKTNTQKNAFFYEKNFKQFGDKALNIHNNLPTLKLKQEKKPFCELCSLYLSDKIRKKNHGKLLSWCRYLFIHTFPKRFNSQIIADLRGFRNNQLLSPFWENIGKNFTNLSLHQADTMKTFGNIDFIKNLFPKEIIYTPLLPSKVQTTIGNVYHHTKPALNLLLKQGFSYSNYINLLDGGPILKANIKNITILNNTKQSSISEFLTLKELENSHSYLLANHSLNFRACISYIYEFKDGSVGLLKNVARTLNLGIGSKLTYSKIHSNHS